jgi:hypothetical protein
VDEDNINETLMFLRKCRPTSQINSIVSFYNAYFELLLWYLKKGVWLVTRNLSQEKNPGLNYLYGSMFICNFFQHNFGLHIVVIYW